MRATTTGQCQPSAEGVDRAGTYDGLLHLLRLGLGDLREALPLRRDDLAVAVANHLLVILGGGLGLELITRLNEISMILFNKSKIASATSKCFK